jgi:uncharacterized membrane-anchored protein YjiN (DUF445 family)
MDTDLKRQAELNRIKWRANGLFWLVTLIFILAAIFEKQYAWLSFVRATAEAAMVGAIADWFAVTALFRYPLGIKIPHTAIIPRRKAVIAQNFGIFVQDNFLSEEVVADKIRSMNVAHQLATWLSQPENSQLLAHHVAVGLKAAVEIVNEADVQALIEQEVVTRIRSTQFAPFAANTVALLVANGRNQELLSGTLRLVSHLQKENEQIIQETINQATPWYVPQPVNMAIYRRLDKALTETIEAVQNNPDHPLHSRFSQIVDGFVSDLKTSPDVAAQEEILKEELLQHPVVQEFSSSLWVNLKAVLINSSSNSHPDVRTPVQQGLVKFGEALLADELLLAKIDRWAEEIGRYLIKEYGHEAGNLITETISRWDTAATTQKIELHTGKDLQFIRINGTLVGGVVGLVIHTVYQLL